MHMICLEYLLNPLSVELFALEHTDEASELKNKYRDTFFIYGSFIYFS